MCTIEQWYSADQVKSWQMTAAPSEQPGGNNAQNIQKKNLIRKPTLFTGTENLNKIQKRTWLENLHYLNNKINNIQIKYQVWKNLMLKVVTTIVQMQAFHYLEQNVKICINWYWCVYWSTALADGIRVWNKTREIHDDSIFGIIWSRSWKKFSPYEFTHEVHKVY